VIDALPWRAGLARLTRATPVAIGILAAGAVLGCSAASTEATPPIVAGSTDAPREVNLIARDYAFVPNVLDLVPGETIRLHVINAGLVVHEAVLGEMAVQDAWEAAEAATIGAPPGPTPVVTVPAGLAGLRVVVQSGERVDVDWTVPADGGTAAAPGAAATGTTATGAAATDAASGPGRPAWLVGCHIPGHWAKGMQIPVRWVEAVASRTLAVPTR
jgi:uncharacterized cupredoxin-like copper-binding protein